MSEQGVGDVNLGDNVRTAERNLCDQLSRETEMAALAPDLHSRWIPLGHVQVHAMIGRAAGHFGGQLCLTISASLAQI